MRIDIHQHGSYTVLRIVDDLSIITDLSELQFLIDGYIKQKKYKIAVGFSESSYIYSGAVVVLLNCHKQLSTVEDGKLCIIEPNKDIQAIFEALNLDLVFDIYMKEDDLPEDY